MPLIINNIPFGLDISDEVLRLIQIKRKRKKNIIIAANELRLPEGVIVDGAIKNHGQLVNLIKQLIETTPGKKITSREVISVLPEKKTFIKLIKAKAQAEENLKETLQKEIPRQIPLKIEEIYFDWQLLGGFKAGKTSEVLIGAAPKRMVEDYLDVLKKARLTPLALEIEAAPIIRCLLNDQLETGPKIIIDMGAIRTGLILYDNRMIQFSVSLPISGNQITKKIAEVLKLELKKAEKAKITCGLDEKKCDGALKKVLVTTVNNLVDKIEEAIDFYQEHFSAKKKIQEIVLSGGSSNLINIDKIIGEKTNIATAQGNPLTKIASLDKSIKLTPAKLQSFTTAIGLALRAYQNNQVV